MKKDILLFQICSQFVLQGALHSSVMEKVNLSTVFIMTVVIIKLLLQFRSSAE